MPGLAAMQAHTTAILQCDKFVLQDASGLLSLLHNAHPTKSLASLSCKMLSSHDNSRSAGLLTASRPTFVPSDQYQHPRGWQDDVQ